MVWATKVEGSTTARLPAGTVVPLDLVLVDQVGMVLPAGVQVTVLPAAAVLAVLVATVVTEEGIISNERVQEVSTTGTQSDSDTRCFAIAPYPGDL